MHHTHKRTCNRSVWLTTLSFTAIAEAEQRWRELKEQGKLEEEQEEEEEDIYSVAKMAEVCVHVYILGRGGLKHFIVGKYGFWSPFVILFYYKVCS